MDTWLLAIGEETIGETDIAEDVEGEGSVEMQET